MTEWRPVAYVALRDHALRHAVDAALREVGWTTLHAATGLDLVRSLSGLILDDAPWLRVGMVVVDDALSGCRGSSIATGLRDLGIAIPIAIVAPGQVDDQLARLDDPDRGTYVLDAALAPLAVRAIARARAFVVTHRAHESSGTRGPRSSHRWSTTGTTGPFDRDPPP
jgi:hypothetical protein